MMKMFKNFNLSDDEVFEIVEKYENLLNMYSEINGCLNDDLRQEIIIGIYIALTKNREK